jgi:hypothetical protein
MFILFLITIRVIIALCSFSSYANQIQIWKSKKSPNIFLAKTEPTAAKQALGDSKWKTAMQAEYDILLAPIAPALYYI